jgi:hypothetical protein
LGVPGAVRVGHGRFLERNIMKDILVTSISGKELKCDICDRYSATMYQVVLGKIQTTICPLCKACLITALDKYSYDGY